MKKLGAAALGILILSCGLKAQDDPRTKVDPVRGFHPGFSYALDQVESINLSNGGLGLNIPLASLPAGPGPSAQLFLVYNSKNWTTDVRRAGSASPVHQLNKSAAGGWIFNFGYQIETVNGSFPSDGSTCQYTALRIVFPDGSGHALYTNDGGSCPGIPLSAIGGTGSSSVATTWYSVDGSFLRLQVPGVTSGIWPTNNWTLYQRDGTTVGYSSANTQVVTDKNGNAIQYITTTSQGQRRLILRDQFGRAITVDHLAATADHPEEDLVAGPGFNGATLNSTVKWGVATVRIPKYVSQSPPKTYGFGLDQYGLNVVKEVVLPTNLSYRFSYASRAGEISQITLPTGATVDYRYKLDSVDPALKDVYWYHVLENALVSKTVTHTEREDGADVVQVEPWTYDFSGSSSTVTVPDGGVTTNYFGVVDYRYGSAGKFSGLIYQVVHPDGSKSGRTWAENKPYSLFTMDVDYNPWVSDSYETVTTAGTPSKMKWKTFKQDKNGNETRMAESDWQAYSATAVANGMLRQVDRTYYNATDDSSSTLDLANSYHKAGAPAFLSLLKTQKMGNGSNTVTLSQFAYDTKGTSGTPVNGKVTDVWHWDSTKASNVPDLLDGTNASYTQRDYDARGNLTGIIDPRGISTKITYGAFTGCGTATTAGFAEACAGLYPTRRVEAFGRTESRISDFDYDFSSGAQTSVKDTDNAVTTTTDYDPFARPKQTTEASMRQTNTKYDDANQCVIVWRDLDVSGDKKLATVRHYDQLGRVRLVQTLESAGSSATCASSDENAGIKVQSRYRQTAAGAFDLVSNPYRAATAVASTEATMGWTRTTRDTMGRIIQTQTFAGAGAPGDALGTNTNSTGKVQTSYSGNTYTVSDQAGKSRVFTTDGLGRLTGVDAGGFSTTYKYDLQDNLEEVRQGVQTRTFKYTSLGRMRTATNPESGTTTYTYDESGNLLTKADARPVTVTFGGYDGLNRPATKNYSDGVTPGITYCYDGVTTSSGCADAPTGSYLKGRITMAYNSVAKNKYTSYDALGRVTGSAAKYATGEGYSFGYSYNLANGLTRESYPSGRVLNWKYDAAGRAVEAHRGEPSAATAANLYASVTAFAAHGGMASGKRGSGAAEMTQTIGYNARLQMTKIAVNNASANGLLTLEMGYCAAATDICAENNGNLRNGTITAPGLAVSQEFTYDGLNRLLTAKELRTGGAASWNQGYGYDEYGNRSIPVNSLGTAAATPGSFDPLTNRAAGGSWDHDAAGNVKVDGAGNAAEYDGEGMLKKYTAGGLVTTFAYDAEGRRAVKTSGTSATRYVYDAGGALAAEYAAGGGAASPCGTCLLVADHLGSTRMVTDGATGAVVARTDYAPFGEELLASAGSVRAGVSGHGGDAGVRQKFTGKERDQESGLDYFGARYYGSALGRFTSPDSGPYVKQDPQAWNRYAYTRNNPLKYIDPSGNYFVIADGNTSSRQAISTLLRSDAGRALVQSIANDPRPTLIGFGRLPIATNANGSRSITNGTTTAIPGSPGQLGGTQVTLDPVNATLTGAATGQSVFGVGLKAFTHELEHVADMNGAKSFQGAAAAGAAGDAPTQPGANNTEGGTAEQRTVGITTGLGDQGQNFTANEATDKEAEQIIQQGNQQYQQQQQRQMQDPNKKPNQ